MNHIIQRILFFLFLVINVLFVDKYASRITEFHLFVSLVYLILGALIVWMVINEHFTKNLDAIHMNILYVLLQSICSSLMESNMLKKRRGKK